MAGANGLHKPLPSISLQPSPRHTQPGVPERFLADLQASVEVVKETPEAGGDGASLQQHGRDCRCAAWSANRCAAIDVLYRCDQWQPYTIRLNIKSHRRFSPVNYPTKSVPDSYSVVPEGNFESRRLDLLAHIGQNPAPSNTKPPTSSWRDWLQRGIPHLGILRAAIFAYPTVTNDCADAVHAFCACSTNSKAKPRLTTKYDTILNFNYWPDEPVSIHCTWTENLLLYAYGSSPDNAFPMPFYQFRPDRARNGAQRPCILR